MAHVILPGEMRLVMVVECGDCGKSEQLHESSQLTAKRKIKSLGWGMTRFGWTCPDCLLKFKKGN